MTLEQDRQARASETSAKEADVPVLSSVQTDCYGSRSTRSELGTMTTAEDSESIWSKSRLSRVQRGAGN